MKNSEPLSPENLHEQSRADTMEAEEGARKVSFKTVLRRELGLVAAKRALRGGGGGNLEEEDPLAEAFKRDLVGLAFSGGGIRSATFNLGVLQALATKSFLRHVDYLSTVSGGGYIGSWLTALLHRITTKTDDHPGNPKAIQQLEEELSTEPNGGNRSEPEAVTFLRQFSNYLTPRVGFLSADTWTVVTIYLRNLLLNLTLLVAAIAVILMLPRVVFWVTQLGIKASQNTMSWGIVAVVLTVIFVLAIGFNMMSFYRSPAAEPFKRLRSVLGVRLTVGVLVVAALCVAVWIKGSLWDPPFTQTVGIATALYTVLWIFAAVVSGVLPRRKRDEGATNAKVPGGEGRPRVNVWWKAIAFSLPAGAVGGSLLVVCRKVLSGCNSLEVATWGPGLALLIFAVTGVLHVGLLGSDLRDDRREWLARAGAWVLIWGLGWTALCAAVTYGPVLVFWAQDWIQIVLASGWLAATLGGLLVGRSPGNGNGKGGRWRSLAAYVAPYVFIVGLVTILTTGLSAVLSYDPASGWRNSLTEWQGTFMSGREQAQEKAWQDIQEKHRSAQKHGFLLRREEEEPVPSVVERFRELASAHFELLEYQTKTIRSTSFAALFLLLTLLLLGWRIDVNEFSMHRFYRNRLVRCYLGASVKTEPGKDERQPLTGFNLQDDIPLSALEPHGYGPDVVTHAGPYHLVNTTLNLVDGDELACQQRKAASFVLSPLYCGFENSYRRVHMKDGTGYGRDPEELTLGSALAISGAAVSPNMGYHSSPAMAFLLTIFNIRLGWWLGNPADPQTWVRSGPSFAAFHLMCEMLGLTRKDRGYVYLSDGGHFENLGIYELVRRGCRFIIASDAGADPELAFEDLGNAIRKIRADFGIDIEIQLDPLRPGAETGQSSWHCAVGTIHYDRRFGPEAGKGTLLYLKASLTGDEPEDVRNYAVENPKFPHQTTADQFFDESQFERYRALGQHVAVEALEAAIDESRNGSKMINIGRLTWKVQQQWYPPSKAPASAFTRHTATLDRLFDQARRSPELAFLDGQFYPEWGDLDGSGRPQKLPLWLPKKAKELRQGFYYCNALIQLMENVYRDLCLEAEHDHPDNAGWINLFRHWSWSGMFRATWAISASTYGLRFQGFCRRHLGLTDLERMDLLPIGEGARSEGDLLAVVEKSRDLNPLERDIAKSFLQGNPGTQIYSLQVAVERPLAENSNPKIITFGCGFALTQGKSIVLLRIQDHLRNMGLGRSAVRALLDEGFQKQPVQVQGGVPPKYEEEFPASGWVRLMELFRSVKSEIRCSAANAGWKP